MESKGLTRAEMIARLGMAPIAIGAFAALCAEADAATLAKLTPSQKQFKYQSTPKVVNKVKEQCSGCTLFKPPHGCQIVVGTISPSGYCTAYSPKAH